MSHWYFDAHRTATPTSHENLRTALWMMVALVSGLSEANAEDRGYAVEMARKEAQRLPAPIASLHSVAMTVIAADDTGVLRRIEKDLASDGLTQPIVSALVRAARALEPALKPSLDLLAALEHAWASSPLDEMSLRRISNAITR